MFCGQGYCQSIAVVPSSPSNVIGGDEIRARDGTTCRQGTHNGPTLDFGVTTGNSNTQNPTGSNDPNSIQPSLVTLSGQDLGAYARVVIPLGSQPERVDCTRLYSLEIERLEMELERLKKSGSAAVTVE